MIINTVRCDACGKIVDVPTAALSWLRVNQGAGQAWDCCSWVCVIKLGSAHVVAVTRPTAVTHA